MRKNALAEVEDQTSQGYEAKAAAYICLRDNRSGKETYGVGVSANITRAGFRAFFSAVDRLMEEK